MNHTPWGYFKRLSKGFMQFEKWAVTGPEHTHDSWDIIADDIHEEEHARLIASAPELDAKNKMLLRALFDIIAVGTKLIARGRLNPNNVGEAYSKADRIARDAIAKAKS